MVKIPPRGRRYVVLLRNYCSPSGNGGGAAECDSVIIYGIWCDRAS
ncbi:hypothetical protein [Kamptonema sp. UHCC 0994]|nr:hypothetical protein [Kamptonema sp. UHCC 0994]MDF0554777.1 hypothetical protein [Kamptonema sp. UHCC 0994]